ncbi:MAG: hypothetical protein CVU88_03640 [Firmicutes bacterium HGW-Firmicutes-13]|nr:MAG: hypothetical protein CVU88_03640 [Firmicutes bacterium HGW-Firmicutes-13]
MPLFLNSLTAGLLAAGLSYILNKISLPRIKDSIYLVTPVIEESAKTFFALGLGGSVFFTHGIFGLIEGVYDLFPFEIKKRRVFLVSFLTHLFFGFLTWVVYIYFISWIFAVVLVSALHILWNYLIIKIVRTNN